MFLNFYTNLRSAQQLKDAHEASEAKLKRLFCSEFRDFAVRLMSWKEYERILKTENPDDVFPDDREILVPKIRAQTQGREVPNFRDYLKKATEQGWLFTAQEQTDWDHGQAMILQSLAFRKLIDQLLANPEAYPKLLEEILKMPLIKIIQNISAEKRSEIDQIAERTNEVTGSPAKTTSLLRLYGIHHIDLESVEPDEKRKELKSLYKRGMEILREATLEWPNIWGDLSKISLLEIGQIHDMLHQPGGIQNPAQALDLINLLVGRMAVLNTSLPLGRCYQVATIYDTNKVDLAWYPESDSHAGWRKIGDRDAFDAQNVLGAICALYTPGIAHELAELSINSGIKAHPVFDAYGHVVNP